MQIRQNQKAIESYIKYPEHYVPHDVMLNLLILRVIGVTEKEQSVLLREKITDIRYIIEHHREKGYRIYLRDYLLIDYIYLLNNSMYIPRARIREIVVSGFLYGCSSTLTYSHLRDYIASLRPYQKPRYGPHRPLFSSTSFHLLWEGKLPLIPISQ